MVLLQERIRGSKYITKKTFQIFSSKINVYFETIQNFLHWTILSHKHFWTTASKHRSWFLFIVAFVALYLSICHSRCNPFNPNCIARSLKEVGRPQRWRLPVVTPTAAPQEGLDKRCKSRVSAPSGTIMAMDPFSLAGKSCVERQNMEWKRQGGRRSDRRMREWEEGSEIDIFYVHCLWPRKKKFLVRTVLDWPLLW